MGQSNVVVITRWLFKWGGCEAGLQAIRQITSFLLKIIIIPYLQAAIANARSLDEVQRLEMLLKTGQVPGSGKQNDNADEEMEDLSNGT